MRINNSRSSEIFDIFSDTMQKFNKKKQELLIKEADRISGAVDAGQTISKWLGAGADIKTELNALLRGPTVEVFELADDAGRASGRVRGVQIALRGVDMVESVDGKLFTTMDDILEFVRGGGRIPATDLGKIVSPQMAMDVFGASSSRNRKLFNQAMQTAMNADGVTPLLNPREINRIYQRMTLQAMANGGKIDPKHFPDVLKGLSKEKIIGLTQNWDDLMSGRAAARADRLADATRVGDDLAEGAADVTRVGDDLAEGSTDVTRVGDDLAEGSTDVTRADVDTTTNVDVDVETRVDVDGTPRPNRPGDGPGPNRPGDGPGPNRPGDGPGPNRPGDGPGPSNSPEVDAEIRRVRDELRAEVEALQGATMNADAARAGQIDALEDALRKLKDLPPNPNVMRQMDALKDAIKGLEATGGAIDATADAAKMSGKAKFLLGLTAVGAAGLAYLYWPKVAGFFEEFPNVRKHDPEKIKQLFSTAHSTMSGCASDTATVLSSMKAVSFTDNQVERAHQRMIRELSTYNSTLSGLKKASLTPNLTQREIRGNISALNRTMTAMGSLYSIYMSDTGEIESFARDKRLFLQMKKDIKKVLPCYQTSLDTVQDEINRLKIDTSEGGSTGAAASVASTGTSGSTNRPGGIPSNAADFMYDPTVMATNIVKVPLNESIRVGNKMITFVNIPMPRGFTTRGEVVIKGAPWIASVLNDSRGKTILRKEYMDIKFDPKMSSLKPQDLFQFATNRAAFKILNAGISEGALDDIEIDESFQDVVLPRSEDKDDSALKEFFTLGLAEDIEDRAGVRTTQQAKQHAQELGFANDGVVASSRVNQLKKISELIMSNENHRSSTNKNKLKDSIRKKSDDFAKSYYKDAKKDLSTEDSFMKSYYAGFSDMYGESQGDKPKLDYKDSYSLHDETGDDLIHEAHPEAIVVSDAIGNGGLVENGSEQKRQSHGVAQRTPTGNYRANYAWLQEGLLKK